MGNPQNWNPLIFRKAFGDFWMKSSEGIILQTRLPGRKSQSPCIFSKEIFILWGILCESIAALPVYFSGNQRGGSDTMRLSFGKQAGLPLFIYPDNRDDRT
jgi:hypothetical protein